MACRPTFFNKPERTMKWKLDFKRGTHVKVYTTDNEEVEGYVAQSSDESTPNFMELRQAVMKKFIGNPSVAVSENMDFVRIGASDIKRVQVITTKTKTLMTTKVAVEKFYRTAIVDSENEFNRLLHTLESYSKVGLNFYGVYIGRDGDLGWITLFAGDTLVCIDVLTLSAVITNFWARLNESLFSNERILKVMYNSRPIVDYLFHKESIVLKNIDDLQVCEFEVWLSGKSIETLRGNNTLSYKTLSEMIETFIQDVHPSEMELLREFEREDFSVTSPLMERPIEAIKYCKCVAIEMKYLLDLHKFFEELLLRKKNHSVTAQAQVLINANSATMQIQMRNPCRIPVEVLNKSLSFDDSDESKDSRTGKTGSSSSSQNGNFMRKVKNGYK